MQKEKFVQNHGGIRECVFQLNITVNCGSLGSIVGEDDFYIMEVG